jgi:3-hydroxyacyl-[acyl-carrier-protein] dehydratase
MDVPAKSLDINFIRNIQKNSYPYLFVDRVTSINPGKHVIATKAFTYNEFYFPGHFDDEPNVPGFIQVECLVQTFLMTFQSMQEYSGLQASDLDFRNVRFQRKIVPGEVLVIEATLQSFDRGVATGFASSSVEGQAACSGEFIIVLPEILNGFTPKG